VKSPIKTVPDVTQVVDQELVSLDPKQLESAMDKAICFVEVTMKPYSIGSVHGIAFSLLSIVIIGYAEVDSIPSPAKRALEEFLEAKKKTRLDEQQ
jgi:hypothetical protein